MMRKVVVAGAGLIVVLLPFSMEAAGLPPDVMSFIERRDICDHFRGEPTEGDAARRQFVQRQVRRYCTGTDKQLARLRKKYAGVREIIARLSRYEICVEHYCP